MSIYTYVHTLIKFRFNIQHSNVTKLNFHEFERRMEHSRKPKTIVRNSGIVSKCSERKGEKTLILIIQGKSQHNGRGSQSSSWGSLRWRFAAEYNSCWRRQKHEKSCLLPFRYYFALWKRHLTEPSASRKPIIQLPSFITQFQNWLVNSDLSVQTTLFLIGNVWCLNTWVEKQIFHLARPRRHPSTDRRAPNWQANYFASANRV